MLTYGMIPHIEIFWQSSHRVGRTAFALGCAVLIALRAAIDWWAQHGLPSWLAMGMVLAVGYSAMCVLSLRLHDRGRSGWWGWVVLILFALAWPLAHAATPDVARSGAAILLVPVFIDLALMPGQKGLNRHGPPPSQRPLFPPQS
ncbi:MAG: DUF805 domain-containing protein [Brevundimonas sp.]